MRSWVTTNQSVVAHSRPTESLRERTVSNTSGGMRIFGGRTRSGAGLRETSGRGMRSLLFPQLQLRDGFLVNFVWTVGQTQAAHMRPGRGQKRILRNPEASVRLDGAI